MRRGSSTFEKGKNGLATHPFKLNFKTETLDSVAVISVVVTV
jgi:hypothetical protein